MICRNCHKQHGTTNEPGWCEDHGHCMAHQSFRAGSTIPMFELHKMSAYGVGMAFERGTPQALISYIHSRVQQVRAPEGVITEATKMEIRIKIENVMHDLCDKGALIRQYRPGEWYFSPPSDMLTEPRLNGFYKRALAATKAPVVALVVTKDEATVDSVKRDIEALASTVDGAYEGQVQVISTDIFDFLTGTVIGCEGPGYQVFVDPRVVDTVLKWALGENAK